MNRLMKIAAATFIGLIGALFALDNLFNLEAAYAAVSFVVSGAEQPAYQILGPVVTAEWLTWLAVFVIISGELSVGVLGLTGAFRMMRQRAAGPDEFKAAKKPAVYAGVLGMLVWYGLFIVLGEGYFHMWQTEIGLASVEGAFRYGSVCGVLMFYLSLTDD